LAQAVLRAPVLRAPVIRAPAPDAVPRGGMSPTMTSKSSSRLDNFLTEFVTEKKTVIRSKSLRIPEIIVNVCLITGVLGYYLVYKLNFFVERNDLSPDVRPIYAPAYENWWTCSSKAGTCQYDVPEPDTLDYCMEEHDYSFWDEAKKTTVNKKIRIDCNPLDMDDGFKEKAGELWITTHKASVLEEKRGDVWRQVPGSGAREFASGAEQIIIFHGTLPRGLGVNASTLGHLQGFLKYANEPDGKARRIPRAKQGEWLSADATHAALKYDWASRYPSVAVSGNDSKPQFFFNSTGCFQVAEEGSGMYCHLPELLMAAGVDLDAQDMREYGMTLDVRLSLTNADVHDFWSWPIGRKSKYVIEASASWGSNAAMYAKYRYHESGNSRTRTDHYGINLIMSPESSWAEFSISGLVATLVIAAGVLKYANTFVTDVLVKTYETVPENFGYGHVSRLYRYNATTKSAHEDDIKDLNNYEDFEAHHQDVGKDELKVLFSKKNARSPNRS